MVRSTKPPLRWHRGPPSCTGRRHLLPVGLALSVLATLGHAASDTPKQPGTEAGSEDASWLDTGHGYVVERADNLAEWMNEFFGDVRAEEEAPYSTLRLRFEQEWDQKEQLDSDIKLRGKVHLPKLNKRLSLLFSDEDETTGRDDLLIDRRDREEDVTLQYAARDKKYYRIDFRAGLRSSLAPKFSVRYRYKRPLMADVIGTFSEEVIYRGDDGFASKTRLEFDRMLDENKLLQWRNKVDWEDDEDEEGWRWYSALSLDRRLSSKRVLGYFISANGQTKPNNDVMGYSLGMRYRQNIYRPWLFAEIQPSYRWSKPHPEADRENAAVVLLRLEAVFHHDFSK